MTRRRNNQ